MKVNLLVLSEIVVGGEWIATKRLIKELKIRNPNYSFHLIAFSNKNKFSDINFETVKILNYSDAQKPLIFLKRLIENFIEVRKAIKLFIQQHQVRYLLTTFFLPQLALVGITSKGSKKIFYFHGIRSAPVNRLTDVNYRNLFIKILEASSFFLADKIIVPSKFSKTYVRTRVPFFIRPSKISVVPNFIPRSRQTKISTIKIKDFKKSFLIDGFNKIILYCGRIGKYKGLENLIDAFKSFTLKNPLSVLIIASPSDGIDQEVLKIIKSNILKNKLKKRVRIIFDLKRISLNYLYRSSDVLILPSELENAPLSVLEALSFNTPVLATDVGNISEIIGTIDKKLVLENNSIEEILKGLDYFFSLPKEKLKIIKKRCKFAIRDFTSEKSVQKFMKALVSS